MITMMMQPTMTQVTLNVVVQCTVFIHTMTVLLPVCVVVIHM